MVPLWPIMMPGKHRLAGADPVELRRRQMDDVAERRHRMGAVRVVGEDRPAGLGPVRRR